MVFTLSDLKHLEVMAEAADKTPEATAEVSILLSQSAQDTSLTPMLLTLCNKLRSSGFCKHADALEKKFLILKTAQTHLYRAHKETGEDLIEFAHPDGDNKIVSDVSDNLGDVETIVSKHKKIVDVIQKEPTGKLANYVRQCKIVLAEDENEQIEKLANAARHNLTQASQIVEGAGGMTDLPLSNLSLARNYYVKFMKVMNTKPLTVSLIDDPVSGAEVFLNAFEQKVQPSLGMGVSDEVWEKVKQYIDAAKENINALKSLLIRHYTSGGEAYSGESQSSTSGSTKTVLSATVEKVKSELEQSQSLLSATNKFSSKASDPAKKNFFGKVQGSIKSYVADIQSILNKLSSLQENGIELDLNNFGNVLSGVSRFSSVENYTAFKNAIAAYHTKLAQAFEYMKGW